MSTKGDLATNNTSLSTSKSLASDPSLQKNLQAIFKKSTTAVTPLTSSTSEKQSSLSVRTQLHTEGNQPRLPSSSTSPMNFTSRFLTKSPLRALTIDTTPEASSFNVLDSNRLGPYSATHNPANQHVHTRNSLVSSISGNLSAKYSRAIDSFKRPTLTSPSKTPLTSKSSISGNFPYTAISSKSSSILGNNFASSFLNSLTPTSLQAKKLPNKSYSQERQKAVSGLYGSYEQRGTPTTQLRKVNDATEHSHISESNRSINKSTNLDTSTNQDKRIDTSIYGLLAAHANNLNSSLQTPSSSKKFMMPIPNHEPSKCSVKRNGFVKAYAANTNQGIVRNYNEDRVAIILNIMKPASRVNEEWPKCSFFGVYDGHGGVACADFLRDNLHQFVIKEPSFPWNPKEALFKGFAAAEKAFLELAESNPNGGVNRSGSCALTVLIVGDMCYVANVGDSRAVMSGDGGTKIYPLSKDHKPNEENEQKRIIEAGGKIYQSQTPVVKQMDNGKSTNGQMQLLLGPHRVFPGRLSVCRTFGDIEAKLAKFGGNPNVVIALPEIKAFRISQDHDFIILATDGIYDKLSSRDVIRSVWESTKELSSNVHHQCGVAIENIMSESINRRTLDNITVVMISFENFKQKLFPHEKSIRSENQDLSQKESDSSSTHKSSFISKTQPDLPISGSSFEVLLKREEQNLQEKSNIDEKANNERKLTLSQKLSNEIANISKPVAITPKQKTFNPFRENNMTPELNHRKENTKIKEPIPISKGTVPISDVNLMSKRLIAKRNEQQKQSLSNKSSSQVSEDIKRSSQYKSRESGQPNIIKT